MAPNILSSLCTDYSAPRTTGILCPKLFILKPSTKYEAYSSRSDVNYLISHFNAYFSVQIIAVDVRNHGDSPQTSEFNYNCLAEDIRELMDDLKIKKINAIGHSLGGRAMMFLALKYVRNESSHLNLRDCTWC